MAEIINLNLRWILTTHHIEENILTGEGTCISTPHQTPMARQKTSPKSGAVDYDPTAIYARAMSAQEVPNPDYTGTYSFQKTIYSPT